MAFLVTPHAVPIYDGVGQPDEPYRYVSPPAGYQKTKAATSASASTLVVNGTSTDGLNITTAESGAQFSAFFPQAGFAAPGGKITATVTPVAPTGPPAPGTTPDGNAYDLRLTDPQGAVTFTPQAKLATLYMRATSGKQPGPTMYLKADGTDTWKPLDTTAAGVDIYVALAPAAGQYLLAFGSGSASASGASPLPYVLGGLVVLLLLVVLVVRLRAGRTPPAGGVPGPV